MLTRSEFALENDECGGKLPPLVQCEWFLPPLRTRRFEPKWSVHSSLARQTFALSGAE